MSRWLPPLLAAAATAVLIGVPRQASARLGTMRPSPRTVRSDAFVPLVAAALGFMVGGAVLGALGAAAAFVVRRSLVARRRAVDIDRERRRALEALALVATDLRAGRSPAEALAAAADVAEGPTRAALAAAAAEAVVGADVTAALAVDGSAVPEVLRGLAVCWAVCSSAGSGLAAGVERLEEGLRAAQEQRRAVEGELAGPRATASLLAVLPLAGIGLAGALGARPLHVLLHTAVGVACLVVGVALDVAGVLWTQRLVARALSS